MFIYVGTPNALIQRALKIRAGILAKVGVGWVQPNSRLEGSFEVEKTCDSYPLLGVLHDSAKKKNTFFLLIL